jgi:hypothetical protein
MGNLVLLSWVEGSESEDLLSFFDRFAWLVIESSDEST